MRLVGRRGPLLRVLELRLALERLRCGDLVGRAGRLGFARLRDRLGVVECDVVVVARVEQRALGARAAELRDRLVPGAVGADAVVVLAERVDAARVHVEHVRQLVAAALVEERRVRLARVFVVVLVRIAMLDSGFER